MTELVNNKVQQYRKAAKVTQEQLAEAVGVTRQTIIAIERGNYTPSVALVLRLAAYFNEPVENLFSLTEN